MVEISYGPIDVACSQRFRVFSNLLRINTLHDPLSGQGNFLLFRIWLTAEKQGSVPHCPDADATTFVSDTCD